MADGIIQTYHVWILMCGLIGLVSAGNIMDRSRLHKSLLHDAYDTTVFPGSSDSPLEVSVQFRLVAFNDFDEKAGRFAASGFLITEWKDERIIWDPSDFGKISSTQLPQSRVWTPNIIVWNSYNRVRPLGYDTLPVWYNHSGDAVWEPGNLFETSCDAKVRTFPFDVQSCTINIFSYAYLENEINFTAAGIDDSNYETNGLWDIVSVNMFEVPSDIGTNEKLMIEIQFVRRSTFHVIHTLVPLIIISVLNILVFIIPVDSSCRIDYAVTMLLTLSVFLTGVSSTLPESSLPYISYFSVLILIQIISSSLILVCAITSFSLGSHSETCLRLLTFVLKPFMSLVAVPKHSTPENSNKGTEMESPDGDKVCNENVKSLEAQISLVSRLFDYICIVLFSLEVVIVNMVFFILTNT
ncbi:acetylcholine receptor subunit beta-type unc-29-like [Ylistrum balloti]|uniref:acetylcholine receptor subunit beta-type unc-29-like n=1 Tax=Ylistrum balloti TaxID=509963 RepID=UPI0029059832|nr:acetylcholine receptor subunit beta-type unc-29-like [Ylistrum balloti]